MLNPEQFHLPGMEHLGPEAEAVSKTSPYDTLGSKMSLRRDRPVGMRGSVQERSTAPARDQRMYRNRERFASYKMRNEDDSMDPWDEEPEPHPMTGLPSAGNLPTHADYGGPHMGFEARAVPRDLTYHGSARSARRAVGTVQEVPITNMGTPQHEVSSQRVHQILEDPGTRFSPRFFGKGMEELPHVYHDRQRDEYTTIDGNHRMAAEKLRGQMLQPAVVLHDEDIPEVQARTRRLQHQAIWAKDNPRAKPQEEVERQIRHRVFGTS